MKLSRDSILKIRFIGLCVGIMLVACCILGVYEERTVTVCEKQLIQEVSGSHGSVATDVYYLVNTDNGNYNLKTKGAFTFDGGALEVGETYKVKVVGLELQPMGVRPNIISAEAVKPEHK